MNRSYMYNDVQTCMLTCRCVCMYASSSVCTLFSVHGYMSKPTCVKVHMYVCVELCVHVVVLCVDTWYQVCAYVLMMILCWNIIVAAMVDDGLDNAIELANDLSSLY